MSTCISSPRVSLQNIAYELPTGRRLLNDVSCTLDIRHTGIVGPNGVGKSVLAKIICGELMPSSGTIQTQHRIAYVPQSWMGSKDDDVKTVLGLEYPLQAMAAIEKGSINPIDFELAEPWWNWQSILDELCEVIHFNHDKQLTRSIGSYSGGEQLRWMWLAALLKGPDIVVMDEPSNHLDSSGRQALIEWLKNCSPLVIIVSHDRDLLGEVNHIVELTQSSCYQHGGNFEFFNANRKQRLRNQLDKLSQTRQQLSKERNHAQVALEKQQQRTAGGKAAAHKKDRSSIEVGAARNNAGASMQRQRRLYESRLESVKGDLETAQQSAEWSDPIAFELPDSVVPNNRKICSVENLSPNFPIPLHPPLSFQMTGAQRLQIQGDNGAGKSLLLNALNGDSRRQHLAHNGDARIHVPFAYLDQHNRLLDVQLNAVDNFQKLSPGLSGQEMRERLAWVRLRAQKAEIPIGALSGGEQLKVAIAIALLGPLTPQLLLLDEPTNHLDLDSLEALEQALSAYRGAMILVSHDSRFVRKLGVSHCLTMASGEMIEIAS